MQAQTCDGKAMSIMDQQICSFIKCCFITLKFCSKLPGRRPFFPYTHTPVYEHACMAPSTSEQHMSPHRRMTRAAGKLTPAARVVVATSTRTAPMRNAVSTIFFSSDSSAACRHTYC